MDLKFGSKQATSQPRASDIFVDLLALRLNSAGFAANPAQIAEMTVWLDQGSMPVVSRPG